MNVTKITVVLAVDPNNQHAERLRALRRHVYGAAGDTVQVNGLSPKQRRLISIWRRFGDYADTEVA